MKKLLCLMLLAGLGVSARAADEAQKADARLDAAKTVMDEIMSVPDKAVPDGIARKAVCVGVVPSLKKGAFIEAEGELRYREFQPKGSDAKVRAAEIHAISILTLDRAEKTEHEGESASAESAGDDELPF